jgi:hypothetical protein
MRDYSLFVIPFPKTSEPEAGTGTTMQIHWKRILIAGIMSELVLLAVYLVAKQYAGSAFPAIAVLDAIACMFFAGLWTVRKMESRFVLHGVLVGIAANIVYAVLRETMAGYIHSISRIQAWASFFGVACIKILVCAAGAYVGGRLSAKSRPTQTTIFPI